MTLEERYILANSYYELGVIAYRTGHYDEAISHFESGIDYGKDTPKLFDLYLGLAEAYSKEMMHDEAVDTATKAIMIKKNAKAYKIRASVLARSGDYEAANNDFLKARSMEPEDPMIITRG